MTKQVLDSPMDVSVWQAQLGVSERQQQEHYDHIAADYEAHYSDEWSVEYRRRFIYEPMFAGLESPRHEGAGCDVWQRANYELPAGTRRECDRAGYLKRGH